MERQANVGKSNQPDPLELQERQIANEVALQTDKTLMGVTTVLLKTLAGRGVGLDLIEEVGEFLYQSQLYCYAKGAHDLRQEIERAVVAGMLQ